MDVGCYIAVSGALACQNSLENLTHNIANSGNPGFKKFMSQVDAVPSPGSTRAGADPLTFAMTGEAFRDDSMGHLEQNGNGTDLAIEGEGNFVLTTPRGPVLTRDGRFRISNEGKLVSPEGHPVQGAGGQEISVSGQGPVEIRPSGEVFQDGAAVGQIEVQTAPGTPAEQGKFRVLQGHLESSNVNAVEEMVKMVESARGFSMHMKCLESFQQLDERLTTTLGRV